MWPGRKSIPEIPVVARKPGRAPGEQQRDHVGKIMDGVGNQRQRIRGIAKNQLRNDEHRVERNACGKRESKIVRRMAVPGMAMPVRMVVVMIVMMGHAACDNRCGEQIRFDRSRL